MNRVIRILLAAISLPFLARADDTLVVHEWGTFTSLQDEAGDAVGGINTDDEPVPPFVHDLARRLLIPPAEVPPSFFQGAPSCHPDVTMRLETPVIYFHGDPATLDVRVEFKGGWLTQFYPDADSLAPGIDAVNGTFTRLRGDTTGSLEWRGLEIGASGEGPETDEHVWLAPRAVDALEVETPSGEKERFLFYRGVAHLDAPIKVVRGVSGGALTISRTGELPIATLWLVDIRRDGTAALRTIRPHWPVETPATFDHGEHSTETVATLRKSLHGALVGDGLFPDEADALLNTWELSYFKSAGLRLFFLVPREWTDRHLPLAITGNPKTVRTMVGRIELVTPEQRALLKRIAASPVPDPWKDLRQPIETATLGAGDNGAWNDLFAGKRPLASLGVPIPAPYADYLDLGRFRNALILDQQRRTPEATLAKFIEAFQLGGYSIPSKSSAFTGTARE